VLRRGPKPKCWRGYRNCSRCTRWRPVSDFPVRRLRSGYEQIEAQCECCKRAIERERYDNLDDKAKAEYGRRVNERTRRARKRQLAKIHRAAEQLAAQDRKLEQQYVKIRELRKEIPRGHWSGVGVDIVPFRMWLLRRFRVHGYSLDRLAADIGQDPRRVKRWIDGFEWNGIQNSPIPIRAINKETVIAIGDNIEEPRLLQDLYPGEL
jgi:hypothetical protein